MVQVGPIVGRMLVALVPVLVALVGLLLYAMASNPRVARIGEILFFVGAFWTVGHLAGRSGRLL